MNMLTIYICLIAIATFSTTYATDIVVLPVVIYAVLLEEMRAFCTMMASFVNASGLDSSSLFFRIRFPNGTEVVPSHEMTIVNRTTAELFHSPTTPDLQNASVVCYVNNSLHPVVPASSQINICERPSAPIITKYEVLNWKTLHVHYDHISTFASKLCPAYYNISYKNSLESEYTACNLPGTVNECVVDDVFGITLPDNVLYIKAVLTNSIGTCSTVVLVQLMHIVKPTAVKDLYVVASTVDPSVFSVKFESPREGFEFLYMLDVACRPGSFNMSMMTNPTQESSLNKMLYDLPAYSECTVLVKAKLSLFLSGYWGVEDKYTFSTPQKVPLGAPEVNRNGFELFSHPSGARDVVVYFKPMPHDIARGRVVEYRLQYICCGHSAKQVFPAIQQPFLNLSNLLNHVDYYMVVDARTEVGYNDSLHLDTIYIPKLHDVPAFSDAPGSLLSAVILSQSEVRCYWSPQPFYHYTLFWCRVTEYSHSCSDVISWKRMPKDVSNYTIILPESELANSYSFGISVENNHGYASGIMWCSCVTSVYKLSLLPPAISLLSMNGCCEPVVLLKKPPCSVECNGHIVRYVIYSCLVRDEAVCNGVVHIQTVDVLKSEMEIVVSQLWPWHKYLLLVESVSAAGTKSLHNSTLVVTTTAVGHDTLFVILCSIIVLLVIAIISIVCWITRRIYKKKLMRQMAENHRKKINSVDESVMTDILPFGQAHEPEYSYPAVSSAVEDNAVGQDIPLNSLKKCMSDVRHCMMPLLSSSMTRCDSSKDIDCIHILPSLVRDPMMPVEPLSKTSALSLVLQTDQIDKKFTDVSSVDDSDTVILKRFLPPASLSGSSEFNTCLSSCDVAAESGILVSASSNTLEEEGSPDVVTGKLMEMTLPVISYAITDTSDVSLDVDIYSNSEFKPI